jgi:VIT1/CCC1 family predicted Fe2+/Mn2+ transporter
MMQKGDTLPADAGGPAAATGKSWYLDALDPVDRASEILFGLIMVLTVTLSLSSAGGGEQDVRTVLIGALGCNVAWGIIDAAMYLLGVSAGRSLDASALQSIRATGSAAGQAIVADHLPSAVLPALTTDDLERIRVHLNTLPSGGRDWPLGRENYLGALLVFMLVSLCVLPIALPFFFFDELSVALRISNAVAVVMLFLTGFAFGRQVGRPWHVGFSMVAIGISLVAIAMALGG